MIPAVFLSYEEYCKETENRMVEALFVSAGIGAVIAEMRSIGRCIGWMPGGDWFSKCDGSRGLAYLQGAMRSVSRMQRHLPSKICWD